jgi:hypothetical protein
VIPNESSPGHGGCCAIRLNAGAFLDLGGTIQLSVPVATGITPVGTRAQWRRFPIDAAGTILPFATASGARAPHDVVVVSPTTLTAILPIHPAKPPGPKAVVVTTPPGSSLRTIRLDPFRLSDVPAVRPVTER